MGNDNEEDKPPRLANVTVSRIMRRTLPSGGEISEEAKESMTEFATEFITFITKEACIKCHNDNRKIVYGDDIRWVLTSSEAMFKYFSKCRMLENEIISGSTQDSNEETNIDLNVLRQESIEDQVRESRTVPNPFLDVELAMEDLENESRTPVEIGLGLLGEANDSEDLRNKRRTLIEYDFGIVDKRVKRNLETDLKIHSPT